MVIRDQEDKDMTLPLKEIEEAIKKCYGCSRCTSGCPVAFQMDFPPSLIVRYLALGKIEKLLGANTIWLCSGCQTCFSRCPFEINLAHIIDLLKEYAYKNKLNKKERPIQLFHEIFLANVRSFGRIQEASFIAGWKMRSGKLFNDLSLGMQMFLKGKLPIFPKKITGQKEVKDLFKGRIPK